jgi:hypothetical protein
MGWPRIYDLGIASGSPCKYKYHLCSPNLCFSFDTSFNVSFNISLCLSLNFFYDGITPISSLIF